MADHGSCLRLTMKMKKIESQGGTSHPSPCDRNSGISMDPFYFDYFERASK